MKLTHQQENSNPSVSNRRSRQRRTEQRKGWELWLKQGLGRHREGE
jgi:hypothetical protein